MKKRILNMLFIIFMAFLIPILFTNKFKAINTSANDVKIEENKEIVKEKRVFDYGAYNSINLLHNDTGEIENLPLDTYLYGVVAAEMPASYDIEALKAQATVARTYTIYKIINGSKHENADICDDPGCCQAWISKENRFARWEPEEQEANWEKIVSAVDDTIR